MHALDYKVIVLDEVHERSVESDLVLVCVKQFLMKNNNLRLTPTCHNFFCFFYMLACLTCLVPFSYLRAEQLYNCLV